MVVRDFRRVSKSVHHKDFGLLLREAVDIGARC